MPLEAMFQLAQAQVQATGECFDVDGRLDALVHEGDGASTRGSSHSVGGWVLLRGSGESCAHFDAAGCVDRRRIGAQHGPPAAGDLSAAVAFVGLDAQHLDK
jgi:hypothetical protein